MAELKYGSRGMDVLQYKGILFHLGYLKACTHDRFGADTLAAVKAFQKDNHLTVDGIIGKYTSKALQNAAAKIITPVPPIEIKQYLTDCPGLGSDALVAINLDLQDESPDRIAVVQQALRWLFPLCLYVFGANLYTSSMSVQLPTPDFIDHCAAANPQYFSGGRAAWMKAQYAKAVTAKQRIGSADCSGLIVGILRFLKMVTVGFDTTANGLYHSYCKAVAKGSMHPGDCVFKQVSSGHIVHTGLYVGAGYTIEAAGGAYGVQLSRLDDHIIINKMTGHAERHAAWTKFGQPKYYK